MKQKIKIYRMSIARVFPATHPRAGEETHFKQSILNGQGCSVCSGRHSSVICIDLNCNDASIVKKIHTIRAIKSTGKTWTDKIREVQEGKAVLVVYQWNEKPYSSDGCSNLFVFGTGETRDFIDELLMKSDKYKCAIPIIDSGIGVQKAFFTEELDFVFVRETKQLQNFSTFNIIGLSTIAQNDGLSEDDFKTWFADKDLNKPFEIIHFTKFRY